MGNIKINKDPDGRTLYYVACDVILMRNGKVLMGKRANTKWMNGYWNLIGGHIEDLETIEGCVSREVKEELGIDIFPNELKIVQCVQRVDGRNAIQFYAFCEYKGEKEPEIQPEITSNGEFVYKSDELGWFDLDNLPENTVPISRHALEMYAKGQIFSRFELKN